MIYITRREVFAASHRIYIPHLSDDENFKIFGKCSYPGGHGHNYILEVTICGELDSKTGYLVDLKKLKDVMTEHVIDKVDHRNLNIDVDFMKDIIPTSENITIAIWNQLVNRIPKGKLYSVKLYETENNYVEYRGE
jgi:6-pyruvoyltetrahydropterin/6-carboxytetrahydropterin synthase